jgi:hypothetical protein
MQNLRKCLVAATIEKANTYVFAVVSDYLTLVGSNRIILNSTRARTRCVDFSGQNIARSFESASIRVSKVETSDNFSGETYTKSPGNPLGLLGSILARSP